MIGASGGGDIRIYEDLGNKGERGGGSLVTSRLNIEYVGDDFIRIIGACAEIEKKFSVQRRGLARTYLERAVRTVGRVFIGDLTCTANRTCTRRSRSRDLLAFLVLGRALDQNGLCKAEADQ